MIAPSPYSVLVNVATNKQVQQTTRKQKRYTDPRNSNCESDRPQSQNHELKKQQMRLADHVGNAASGYGYIVGIKGIRASGYCIHVTPESKVLSPSQNLDVSARVYSCTYGEAWNQSMPGGSASICSTIWWHTTAGVSGVLPCMLRMCEGVTSLGW